MEKIMFCHWKNLESESKFCKVCNGRDVKCEYFLSTHDISEDKQAEIETEEMPTLQVFRLKEKGEPKDRFTF